MARFFSNPGSPDVPLREPVVRDDGTIQVVTVGVKNIQDEIQSQVSQTLIPNIIQRFTQGDSTALSVNTPLYGDFTQMPSSYAQFLQKMIDGEKLFNKLAPEIRDKFGNSYQKFLAESSSPDFLIKSGLVKPLEKVDDSTVIKPIDSVMSDVVKDVIS